LGQFRKYVYYNFNQYVQKQKVGPLDNMIIVTKKTLSNVSLSKQKLIEACVQLVTVNGRPFTLMDDSGFKMIIDPLLDTIGGGKHYFFLF